MRAETIDDYASAMTFGLQFPPIVVFYDGRDYWTADGFHRLAAAQRTKARTITAEVIKGTKRDALLYAVGANAQHGLPRTNADKRHAVGILLVDAQWKQWSDREISRRCAVSDRFVNEVRDSLRTIRSDDTARTYRTKHGGVATMETNRIGKPTPPDTNGNLLEEPPPNKHAVHFSSETAEHYTPKDFLEVVYRVFGGYPDLDPCSNSDDTPNVAAHVHYSEQDDGLSRPWRGRVFMNPPYGREIGAWVEKLRREWARGEVIELIALLPARTDTAWFEALTADTDDLVICFLGGRLTFIGNEDPAPFPSMAAYIGPNHDEFVKDFLPLGSLWQRPSRPIEWFVSHV
jgi:hypothetical protein